MSISRIPIAHHNDWDYEKRYLVIISLIDYYLCAAKPEASSGAPDIIPGTINN